MSESQASRLSALTAVAAFAGYFRFLDRRWPLSGRREALGTGGIGGGMIYVEGAVFG